MKGIDLWFPTAIGYVKNLLTEQENNNLIAEAEKIKNKNAKDAPTWNCNVLTTFNNYNLIDNPNFTPLFEKISKEVHEFAQTHNSFEKYEFANAWLNYNDKDHYQEYHVHDGSIISVIYYVKVPEGSGLTVFKSPITDMLPMKNIEERNNYNYPTCQYKPEERKLLIFRSYTPHLVTKGNNNEQRISFSANLF